MLRVTFILLLAALLASCSGPVYEQARPVLQQPFVLTADCSGTFTGSIRFSYSSHACWEICYLSPQTAAGLTLRCENGQLLMKKDALQSSISAAVLPQHAAFRVLCDAVTLCSCTEPQRTEEGLQLYENSRLRVTVQNGVVQSIACLESGSSYRITGFQLLSAPSD
ncbi:MAG: hypothetical protein IKV55_03100 [Oscillospiraceae bacterium]|nr:hypothetical protein [Oscillospiraceae bacterium]